MNSVDSLPGDQRAVLQLVLGRGRSYDEIARLLSINPRHVRERAHAALDALGPETRVSAEDRAEICDYLLGQLPSRQVADVRDVLSRSPRERAWARVVSSELAPIASGPLPEIPVDFGTARDARTPPPLVTTAPDAEPAADADDERRPSRRSGGARESSSPGAAADAAPARSRSSRSSRRADEGGATIPSPLSMGTVKPRSSRLGGMLIIAGAVVLVAVVVIIIVGLGGSSAPKHGTSSTPTTSTGASASSSASSSSSTTSSTSGAATPVAQFNLTPPASAAGSKAVGIAEVLKEGTSLGIAIVASNIPANTTKPANAYAVWLYNSPTDAHILGFVNPGVGSTGRLSTAGTLPSNASHYKELLVTVETSANPKTPGQIILQGPLSGV